MLLPSKWVQGAEVSAVGDLSPALALIGQTPANRSRLPTGMFADDNKLENDYYLSDSKAIRLPVAGKTSRSVSITLRT
jgi:hypothetical protein